MSKKLNFILTLLILVLSAQSAHAVVERYVTHFEDENVNGTLRRVLLMACDAPDDDEIHFAFSQDDGPVLIRLAESLAIPENCIGNITLVGNDDQDVIIDARDFSEGGNQPGDSCIIHVYSDDNQFEKLSLVNNETGAGICFFGANNKLKDSRVGITMAGREKPNRFGVVVSDVFDSVITGANGSGAHILGSTIAFNLSHGVLLEADSATITDSIISANGGCPGIEQFSTTIGDCENSNQQSGAGVFVLDGYTNIVVGGEALNLGNTIQYNRSGGVIVEGPSEQSVVISHNVISKNYGLNIDLSSDGLTLNDSLDLDVGPNDLLNFPDYVQVFYLNGQYQVYGASAYGRSVEIYGVSEEEYLREPYYGGGDYFLDSATVQDFVFEYDGADLNVTSDEILTFLTQSDSGTSEFFFNIPIGADADFDGLPDSVELGVDNESSDPNLVDTDDDGLPDVVEDKNRNGVWDVDEGETCAYIADSDGDLVSDGVETLGDGVYDVGFDTNPLDPDTDGDGLLDGEEDKNGNGIWELYLGETFPLDKDTDNDFVNDGDDNCPHIYNPGQEANFCQGG